MSHKIPLERKGRLTTTATRVKSQIGNRRSMIEGTDDVPSRSLPGQWPGFGSIFTNREGRPPAQQDRCGKTGEPQSENEACGSVNKFQGPGPRRHHDAANRIVCAENRHGFAVV